MINIRDFPREGHRDIDGGHRDMSEGARDISAGGFGEKSWIGPGGGGGSVIITKGVNSH